jgi:hypothetical protein
MDVVVEGFEKGCRSLSMCVHMRLRCPASTGSVHRHIHEPRTFSQIHKTEVANGKMITSEAR